MYTARIAIFTSRYLIEAKQSEFTLYAYLSIYK